ncbi:alpha/beta fold hydrolase [Secundilactobacillus folii]|uniref:Alpha/beta fold hydrolase n=1 Tax=Secundilactobacillus folii TaxID=2678357 RepID=A0A7X3C2N5_9LACO|nr:alpha/beta hydrolase [Secundilactobacillus folii]MTV82017.1 alpha/beta fold hydrolase [Secundilactobacillus folii]
MKFTTSDHVQLAYSDEGTGQPVVLIGGIGSYQGIWLPTQQYLVAQGYRVVTMDARNQGLSQRTIKGRRISRHAMDLAELLAALDLQNVIGIGNSMGASTLFAYASLFGKGRFKSFVDVDQSPKMIADRSWSFGFKNLTWDNFPAALKLPMGPATATPVTDEVRQAVQQARANHPYNPEQNYPCLVDHAFQDWRDVLLRLQIPLLVVAGDQSPYFDPHFASATTQLAPLGESAVVQHAGHIVMAEQPARFNAILSSFLAK